MGKKPKEAKWVEVGEKLKQLRKKEGKSIFKVARALHISGNYLASNNSQLLPVSQGC